MEVADSLQIVRANSSEQFKQVRELLAEYIAWDSQVTASLGIDANILLEFQYQQGAIELPGEYAPPDGCLLLAVYGMEAAGCGALKKFDEQACEIKRMYVRPAFRGKQIGRRLLETLIQAARESGYAQARIETVTFMKEALALYYSLGFRDIEPYYEIPDEFKPITLFMELAL
jgi:GNAT superfamily N-acetyltransferase